MTTLYGPATNNTEETPMDHCDFCDTDVESSTTGTTGVSICADCRSEADIEVTE